MASLTWLEPALIDTGVNPGHEWRTACGRYRVVRVQGPEPRFLALATIADLIGSREQILANDLGRLAGAIDAVERHVREDANCRTVESNRDHIEAKAEHAGIDVRAKADLKLTPDQMRSRRESLERLLAKKQESAEPSLAIHTHAGKSVSAAAGVCRTNEQLDKNRSTNMSTKNKKKAPKARKAEKKTKPDVTPAEDKKPIAMPKANGKLSAINGAYQVLVGRAGTQGAEPAMTCPDLITEMEGQGLWKSPGGKTPAATLYSAILREIGKGADSRFVKADRGKFAAKV